MDNKTILKEILCKRAEDYSYGKFDKKLGKAHTTGLMDLGGQGLVDKYNSTYKDLNNSAQKGGKFSDLQNKTFKAVANGHNRENLESLGWRNTTQAPAW